MTSGGWVLGRALGESAPRLIRRIGNNHCGPHVFLLFSSLFFGFDFNGTL